MGRKHTEESKAKISAAMKGRTISDKARAALLLGSTVQKGKKRPSPSAETRAKLSAALKGRPFTPEHRANLLGVIRSPEGRARISAAQLRRFARERWEKEQLHD